MPFHYTASDSEGNIVRGKSNLPNREDVLRDLGIQGLSPISVENAFSWDFLLRFGGSLVGKVSYLETVLFTKHLSVMLRAGLTLLESIRILAEQTNSWRMRKILLDIVDRIEAGEKFASVLAEHPKAFSPFYVNIVAAGEVSGTLEESLDHLAQQYTKDYELRRKVRTAMLYPGIVLVAAALIGFFFATYVLPQVAGLFGSLKGIDLPLSTRIMLKISKVAREHTLLSFLGMLGLVFGSMWVVRLRVLAPVTHLIVLRMPVIGKVVKDVNLARFALVMSTMLRTGVPINSALDITGKVLGNMYYQRAIAYALENVQRGLAVSESLAEHENVFPKLATRMVAVGERSGKLEEVLTYLAEFYELEVESTMRNLSTVLEPILLIFIGGIALAMAFAILIPIYNFISAISRI